MPKPFVLILLAALTLAPAVWATQEAVALRCDYAVDPLGVDSAPPRLFWQVASLQRGQRQTAYEIIADPSAAVVEAAAQGLAVQPPVWDTGRVLTNQTTGIPFGGRDLKSNQQWFWKVRVWDPANMASAWSKTATFTLGILSPGDWQAKWIAAAGNQTNLPSMLLRREWTVKPGLKQALINVCGLGQYELTVNGQKIGEDFLSPGWSKYDRTCLYDTRDITASLKTGTNALGLLLGNGMYNVLDVPKRYTKFSGSYGPQKAIAQLRLEYADGSVDILGTDASWRVSPGPITFSSIYGGEDFDARRVQAGWDQPGFDDANWPAATEVAGPGGQLKGLSAAAPPIRAFELHRPVAVTRLTNGDEVFDLGQNASHIPTLRVSGPAGSRVRLLPAELTNADGTVYQGSMNANRNHPVSLSYTKSTDGVEEWTPKFFYIGGRYYQAQFYPADSGQALPAVESFEARVVNTASTPAGGFECSNPLFNRIHKMIVWAQRSNLMSLLTDCPHRERLGWLEQDHLNGPALRYEYDLAQLFTKTMNDMLDSQLRTGLVPSIAPEYTPFRWAGQTGDQRGDFADSPEWSSSFLLVPWQQYEFDGDLELFREHYDAMARHVAYLGTRAQAGILDYGLGDWYDIGPKAPGYSQLTPKALTATAYYFEDVTILSQVAALLGKTDDAQTYTALAGTIRDAFNQRFYHADTGNYATGSQCADAIPLVFGICEESNRPAVVAALVQDLHDRGLTAGDVGYRYLLRALAEGGRSDVIFAVNNQSEKPGYGYQLKQGATSLTEAWNAGRTSSQNHFMLGQINEWFYHDVGGISSDPSGPGFARIIINPQPVGDLTWANTHYDSIHGPISTHWQRNAGEFALQVTIPANTTATVFMPVREGGAVKESGVRADKSPGVKYLRTEQGRAVYAVDAGEYNFQSEF
jgi:hypothetical protein